MKKYWKILAGFLGFCILMGGSVLLYNQLSEKYDMNQNMETGIKGENGEDSFENGEETEGNSEEDVNKAPDFQVEDVDGEIISLSDMEGKPVILNFWASWCPPCKSEMPDFQSVYETYGDTIQFMIVNMTDGNRETRETAEAYIEEQDYTFPVFYDVNQEAAYAFYVTALPATYFINEKGVIVAAGRGMLDKEALERGIAMLNTEEEEQ